MAVVGMVQLDPPEGLGLFHSRTVAGILSNFIKAFDSRQGKILASPSSMFLDKQILLW